MKLLLKIFDNYLNINKASPMAAPAGNLGGGVSSGLDLIGANKKV